MIMNRTIKVKTICLMVLVSTISSFNVTATHNDDFSEMDLEQLINFNAYATSVISAHIHQQGELMFGYNVVNMKMNQLLDGTKKVSTADLTGPKYGYSIAPVKMTTSLQSFHFMYASSDNLTWILMAKYLNNHMHHEGGLENFTSRSRGWADTQLKFNYIFNQQTTTGAEHQFGASLGLSLPTGSISERDITPQSANSTSQLPYAMQLGSGTFDPILGLSYHGMTEQWYWGVQALNLARVTGSNSQGYRLGNQTTLNSWLHYSPSDSIALHGQINFQYLKAIKGEDVDIDPMMIKLNPMANPSLSASNKINFVSGITYAFVHGSLKGHRIIAELNIPIYQDVIGPQLTQQRSIRLGWQLTF